MEVSSIQILGHGIPLTCVYITINAYMSLLWLKACLLMVATVIALQSDSAKGESVRFSGGSIELTPAAGGFVLDHVVNLSGEVVNTLYLELGYTNLFGDRKTKVKNFAFEKLSHGQSFKPKNVLGVTLFYGSDGLPSLDNPAYDATKSYWSSHGNRIIAP